MARRLQWEDYSGTGQTEAEFRAERAGLRAWDASGAILAVGPAYFKKLQTARYRARPKRMLGRLALSRRPRVGLKSRYAATRSQRRALASKYQRQYIRAGLRARPPTNFRTGGFVGMEKKFLDLEVATVAVPSGTWVGAENDPSIDCLNAMTVGTGESQRDGRKITMKTLHVRGFIEATKGATDTTVQDPIDFAIYLVLDTQTNSAQLNAEDVMQNTVGRSVDAHRNLQFGSRFRILRSYRGSIGPAVNANNAGATTVSTSFYKKPFNWNVVLPKEYATVEYKGSTPAIADITTNSLHIIACKETTGEPVTLTYTSRLRYLA